MQNVEIEKQVNLLFMLKCKRMSLSKTAKLSGYSRGAVENVKLREKRIEKIVKDCARILDGGLPYLLWPEMTKMANNGKETEADLRKRIKYLEAQVAYYEELSKLEGLDLKVSSKKNGSGQSSSSLKEESEQ